MSPKSFILFSLFLVFLIQPVGAAGVTDDLGDGRYRVTQGQFVFEYEIDSGHGREYRPLCFECDLPINITYVAGPSQYTPLTLSSVLNGHFEGLNQYDSMNLNKIEVLDIVFEEVLDVNGGLLRYDVSLSWVPPVPNDKLYLGGSVVVNFHGSRVPTTEAFSVDFIPTLIMGATAVEFDRLAWWNASFPFRREWFSNATSTIMPFNIDDNSSVCGGQLWALNASVGERIFVYSTASGLGGGCVVANETSEKNWENASTLLGNNPTSVYPVDVLLDIHLDDGTDANDSSSFNNDGNNNGATSTSGQIGNALSFDADDEDFVEVDSLINDIGSTTVGTITTWVNLIDATPASPIRVIISFSDTDGNEHIVLRVRTDGKLQAQVIDAGTVQWDLRTSSAITTDNTWVYVSLVQNGTDPVILVNGSVVPQSFSTSTDKTSWFSELVGIDNVRMAREDVNSVTSIGDFNGSIDEVVIFNRSLSTTEVQQLYWNGIGNLTNLGFEGVSVAPIVTFIDPIPANGTFSSNNWLPVNVSVSDISGNIDIVLVEVAFPNTSVSNFTMNQFDLSGGGLPSENVSAFFNVTGLPDGLHSYRVWANDSFGDLNVTPFVGSRVFTVDTTAPIVTIDLPLNITHFTDTLEVNASFNDTVPDVIFFSIDGGANSTGVSSPLNSSVTGLTDGVHDVRVCANDTAGNEGCVSRFFTIQAGISIVTPTNTTFLTPFVLLSVASNASVAQWNFSLDGGASNEFTPNITLVLASGAHNIMVFANLTTSGVIRNATVFFTLNYTTSNITFQPPTPNNGTVIEAFDPFTIQANTSFGGSQPIIFFLRNGVSFGSFDLVFKENSTISSEYWMTIDTLTPGNYTYFAQTLIGGASFISAFRNFFITPPLFRESDGSTTFPTEFILVAYLSPPSPVSHDSVSNGGFRVEARAFNINGVVTSTIVEFLSPSGSSVGSSVLSFSNSSNNTWLLFGDAVPPPGFTSLSYRVRVNDSSGRSGSSLDRLITVFVVGGGDIDFAGAIGTIEGTLGVSRGSPERNFGRVMLSLGAIGIMVSGAFGTPLGLTGALPLGVTGIILMARSGDIPVYLGVLGVLLTAGIGVKLFLDMLPSSGEKL